MHRCCRGVVNCLKRNEKCDKMKQKTDRPRAWRGETEEILKLQKLS